MVMLFECESLGGYQYYLGKHFAQRSVAIRFDPESMALICQPEGSEETIRLPAQGVTKAELIGELAALQALPIYQLALPFSLATWRQLEYTHKLDRHDLVRLPDNWAGTTLRDSTLLKLLKHLKL